MRTFLMALLAVVFYLLSAVALIAGMGDAVAAEYLQVSLDPPDDAQPIGYRVYYSDQRPAPGRVMQQIEVPAPCTRATLTVTLQPNTYAEAYAVALYPNGGESAPTPTVRYAPPKPFAFNIQQLCGQNKAECAFSCGWDATQPTGFKLVRNSPGCAR